ncbi:unnamed protein product, partial [Closterium sp. NIES-54]
VHLKTKEVQRELEGSEFYREGREAAWRRQQLAQIEARQNECIMEGWAFMAVEVGEEGAAAGGAEALAAEESREEGKVRWEIGTGLGARAAAELKKVLDQHKGTFAFTLKDLGRCTDTDFSKQAALKDLSPYYLLLGREPILLIDAPKLLSDTVIVGSEERWVVVAEAQAKYLRELLPAALENLHMAQLRDVQRYRQRGAEKGEKGNRVIQARGEVYLKQARKDLLDIGLTTARWRVKEVKDSGVIVLVSEKGEERREHTTNVAAV